MSKLGELHAYVGAMGVGKTTLLCQRYMEDVESGLTVLAIRPSLDTRDNGLGAITARGGASIPCITIDSLEDLDAIDLSHIDKIYIDEVQFFGDVIEVECMFELNMQGIDVEVYGLDLNAMSEDFGVMGLLLGRADAVFKISSTCPVCNEYPVRFSARIGGITDEVAIGDLDEYTPMCKVCFKEHMEDSIENLITSTVLGDSKPVKHSTLENVTYLSEDMVIVELGEEGKEFFTRLIVRPSSLEDIGWSLEDVADIIDYDAVDRLLEEVGELNNE